ncbi:PREDICTED: alkane hydroxylase MAH1-like [Ipomoea nil]|uniref:alkane hydroxylase MAH1-like n=1 Tax=Ipomoea nil TaxID=35883 RepID=UPI0009019572|nr:PREDICTED: alkane hydroxylase MAH1-like [Ipomoea nil]
MKDGRKSRSNNIPRKWAVVGMLPALIHNAYRIHEFFNDFLKESGGTFEFKGLVSGSLDMLITCDPANIHHILSRNFSNYPKGPEFREIFDVLGDGIFNVDSFLWELHRKTTLSFFNHAHFHSLLETNIWHKVEKGLLPVLDCFAEQGVEFDLQDIFQRFTFDSISKLVLDYDPGSLCVDLPYIRCEKAFNPMVDALLYRHIFPESCWKLQRWLGIGQEKKHIQACRDLDEFIYHTITLRQQNQNNNTHPWLSAESEEDLSLFTAYVKTYDDHDVKEVLTTNASLVKFLRDTFLNLMFAGRDTTSSTLTWLFYLLAKNPSVQPRIRDEIIEHKFLLFFKAQECQKLVYLHGALCETLRLFPPVAIQHKVSAEMDVLPTGHRLKPNTRILLSFYSTGRMSEIWGEDCMEFKPERWISGTGGIKHQPSYKFPAFNAGARTCIGKDMAFIQMKMVAATILQRYHFQLHPDSHSVSPSDSVIIQVKHGLKLKFTKRNTTAA